MRVYSGENLVSEISAESKIFPFFSSQNAFSSVTLVDVEHTLTHRQKEIISAHSWPSAAEEEAADWSFPGVLL